MMLVNECLFDPDPIQKSPAFELDALVKNRLIVSSDDHVDSSLFSAADRKCGNPAVLLIHPDHYVLFMRYSQILSYREFLSTENPWYLWRLFAENFFLIHGTPSGLWQTHQLESAFGIEETLAPASVDWICDQIEAALASFAYSPRALATLSIPASAQILDVYCSAVLPANLTQAQRDYFGAHTYRRVDKDGYSTPNGNNGTTLI